jgi:hypothetical protein
MALGPIEVLEGHAADGNLRIDTLKFTGDAAYPTGGTPGIRNLVREALGKGNLTIVSVMPVDCGGKSVGYDFENDKLKVYAGGGAQEANNANLSTTTFTLSVVTR